MDDLKKKFIEGLTNNQPQLLTKNLVGDVETPISCLLKIKKNQKYSFLLESVEGGSLRGRYSLLGCDPDIIWKVENNSASIEYIDENYKYHISNEPIESLKNLIELSKFDRGNIEVPYPILVGYLGYPMIQYMEKISLNWFIKKLAIFSIFLLLFITTHSKSEEADLNLDPMGFHNLNKPIKPGYSRLTIKREKNIKKWMPKTVTEKDQKNQKKCPKMGCGGVARNACILHSTPSST